jgi:GNAT superfamily N-acetyltransferase
MSTEHSRRRGAVLVRDDQSCVPLSKILAEGDLLYLLTPLVPPAEPSVSKDPFDPLGRALARHHRWVRHVPYTPQRGITDDHVAHIGFARVVIFVVSGPPSSGQKSQISFLEAARAAGGQRPQIVLACCSLDELDIFPMETRFPTIVEISGYSRGELESAADLLFGMQTPSLAANPVQRRWSVEPRKSEDMPAIYDLWCEALPQRFRLDRVALQLILREGPGYCQNMVVRDPATRQVVGFCTTFTTYLYSDRSWLGSVAAVIVKPSHRRQGIGSTLFASALGTMKSHGVVRLQLGTTYPRLLYGVPMDLDAEGWFAKRGWQFDGKEPGTGQEACDWLLNINDWNTKGLSASGLRFRFLEFGESQQEYDETMEFVARESVRKHGMGFYYLYERLHGTPHMGDIMLGFEGRRLVASAILYTPRSGSPVSEDIPWPGAIGDDVGGVACICITGMPPPCHEQADLGDSLFDPRQTTISRPTTRGTQ